MFRLIFFIIALLCGYSLFRWWRSARLLSSGGLDLVELGSMMKLAKRSERLQKALMLRVDIVGELTKAGSHPSLVTRVDEVIRQVARQETLRLKIASSVGAVDPKDLSTRLDDARLAAEIDDDLAARERARIQAERLGAQQEQITRLSRRTRELDDGAERILIELRNLSFALLEASSDQASLEASGVTAALGQLEEAAASLREEAEARSEVEKLLRDAN